MFGNGTGGCLPPQKKRDANGIHLCTWERILSEEALKGRQRHLQTRGGGNNGGGANNRGGGGKALMGHMHIYGLYDP